MTQPPPFYDQRSPTKRGADRFVHHPWTEFVLIVLIIASVLMILAETAFPQQSPVRTTLERFGLGITLVFVVELSIRFWVAPKKRRFFWRYWPDILAVMPQLRPLRVLRILMLLRIFRAGALFNRRISIFRGSVRATLQELTMLFTVTAALVLTGAVVLYYTEGADNPAMSGVGSALWFALASTIGGEPIFGEPTTFVGRATTLLLMLGGLTVFGLFIGTVSASMMTRLSKTMEVNEMDLDELRGHTVVCGWNRAGPTVLEELFAANPDGRTVVLITELPEMPADLPKGLRRELLYHVHGDYTRVDTLMRAGIDRAASAVLLTDELIPRTDQDRDARTVLAALTIEKLAPRIFTVAELNHRENEELLKLANVEEIVVAEEYGAVIMGAAERNRGIVSIVDEILTTRYGNTFQKVEVGSATAGKSIGQLHTELKASDNAILLAHIRLEATGKPAVVVNPDSALTVREGDQLVVIATEPPALA